MFGPAFLINPVTEPMYYMSDSTPVSGVKKTRYVYLPKGCKWYDFWTSEQFEGGRTVEAEATLEIIPIYVRAGSIIPMGTKGQHTNELLEAPLELRIYPGENGCFTLYEDEGDNYNYEKGACSTIKILWDDSLKQLTFEKREGYFETMVQGRTFNVVLVSEDRVSGLEETHNHGKTVMYCGEKLIFHIN